MASPLPLAGLGIVVTRPAGQAADFASRLAALGAAPIVFPAIAILPPDDPGALAALHAQLATFDFAVFVSANAVELGLPRGAWPHAVRAIAPGPGTARLLERRGVPGPLSPPERFDSEGVLALPELADVRGRRFAVFRGDGGRELLAEELRRRGALVEQVSCYRRAKPVAEASMLIDAWRAGGVDAVTVTSSEGVANLVEAIGEQGRAYLASTPVFAPHARIADAARAAGCRQVHQTPGGDAGLITGLVAHFSTVLRPGTVDSTEQEPDAE